MEQTHRLAWGGISFAVPLDWNLASHHHDGKVWQIQLEDDYTRRLDVEWMALPRKVNLETVKKRYTRAAQKLAKAAQAISEQQDAPRDWSAFLYGMPDGHRLLTAYHITPKHEYFVLFTLHFDPSHTILPSKVLRQITSSFQIHTGKTIPWRCYDWGFSLNSAFKLVETTFLAGRKEMIFEWRHRRLYLWLFSLATMAMKGTTLPEFVAEYLNHVKGLRGPRFVAEANGKITARRVLVRALGHFDQVQRLCFRYRVGYELFKEKDQIFLWAFHYRKEEDLRQLEGFSPDQVLKL